MFRPRVIPVLLLKKVELVKTVKFKNPTYIGDPINAVKIFNDLEADELAFLDITATNESRMPDLKLLQRISSEACMPFAIGGGINQLESVKKIIGSGAEKVIINSASVANPELIEQAALNIGSQSVVVSIDIKKPLFGKQSVFIKSGAVNSKIDVIEHAKKMENLGAGELIINSIDHDGMMSGYDLPIIKAVSEAVKIPVVALGGAGTIEHLRQGFSEGGAAALAAGSMFVYHGPRKAVLINYPTKQELNYINS